MKIGFFDSGLGGLTILKAVAKYLPSYDYEYYADTASLPLGDKTEDEIFALTKRGVEHLFEKNCLIVVVACNTASAETLRKLQDTFISSDYPERRVLGVIIPTVEALSESDLKSVILVGTKRTIDSGKYITELAKLPHIQTAVHELAVPVLVPLLESGEINEALRVMKFEIEKVKREVGEFCGLILGCTHYVLLKELLREEYRELLQILSQDEIIPEKLSTYLENHPEFESHLSRESKRNIYLTKHREDYDQIVAQFLDGGIIFEKDN
jgi:glutamate racemase